MKENRYGVLDGLRGIAILLVLWFHLWQLSWLAPRFEFLGFKVDLEWIPVFGFIGVDLFFFLSGFCLMIPYSKSGLLKFDFKKFYLNRAFKILPSYWFALGMMSLVLYKAGLLPTPFYKHVLSHLFFIQNLSQETYGSINGIFWSLSVEVQFYLFFPVICMLFLRKPWLTFLVITGLAFLARYFVGTVYFDSNAHFINQLPCVIDLFLIGMMSSHIFFNWKPKKLSEKHYTVLALLSFGYLVFLYHSAVPFRYDLPLSRLWQLKTRFFFGLGFSAFAIASMRAHPWWSRMISNRVLVFFCAISYNLYIWHQFIGVYLMKHHIPQASQADPHFDPNWAFPFFFIALGVGILFSWLVTKYLEKPILKLKTKS